MQKEINKLLKRVSAEKLKNNHKECIELYNIIGGLYSEIGSYDEAIYYHEQALEASKTIGDRLKFAIASRYIGEAKASLGQFYQAIEHIKKYLKSAEDIKNKVEIQRAWTTLGRVYLMQAQDFKDNSRVLDNQTANAALEAEKHFQAALNLAESVRDEQLVDEKEFMQMKASLLINIGLVKDICGQHTDCVMKFNRAIELCRSAKLKEDLYRCQNILTGIFRQRNNLKMAVKSSDDALVTAKQIGKKILICEAYIEKGLVQILQRDFKSAKRSFAQAYMEKSPSEEDHAKAIRLTKLAHLIATNHEKLGHNSNSSQMRLKLCDKLGDLFVAVNSYKLAVEFYRRALNEAKVCHMSKICHVSKSEFARILVSIAETLADDCNFEDAMKFYEKELQYRNDQKEQCQTMIKIAHMHEYLNRESQETSAAYERALDKAGKDPKLMYFVLNDYTIYLEKKSYNASRLKELTKTLDSLKSYPEVVEEIEKVGNDEEADDLEDEISDIDEVITDDEDNNEVLMVGKRRCKGNKRFKANEVGDTPLHEACIKGDMKRVKMLISQGHDVNPRDNAGWIPLHEACNHGHYEIVSYLIENGADVSNRGLKGMSPLHDAATNGHYEIMRLLIKSGANVIALTDTGETILSCLRDYRKRNYNEMSNHEASEYREMENELLNTMDKCGFNLMEANMKKTVISNKKGNNRSVNSNDAVQEVRPRPRLNIDEEPATESVRDYRHIMGDLKRKRPSHENRKDSPQKANLPPTYHAGTSNPSAPTKDWLIDDISKEKHITRGFINPEDLLEFEEGFSDDDEDDMRVNINRQEQQPSTKRNLSGQSDSVRQTNSKNKPNNPKKAVLDSDDDFDEIELDDTQQSNINATGKENNQHDDDDITIIRENPVRTPVFSNDPEDDLDPFGDISAAIPRSPSVHEFNNHSFSSRSNSRFSPKPAFNLLANPLTVSIGGRKLLVPVKDEYMTVKFLKESIVERYSALTQAKPVISLVPASDPDCILFNDDLCLDVIRQENVVAIIDSWTLETIDETYVKCCEKSHEPPIEPLTFIRAELRRILQSGNKLDLTYARFPHNQVEPVLKALAHRDFSYVNLSGSVSLLDCLDEGRLLMDTLGTWRKLKNLNLSCIGLRRCHFGTICSKIRLPELTSLDVSINAIAYKCKEEFRDDVESLLESCPNLKRLDIRKNHLQFLKLILESSSSSSREFESSSSSTAITATSVLVQHENNNNNNSNGNNNNNNYTNLAKVLEFRQNSSAHMRAGAAAASSSKGVGSQFELLAGQQKEYSIYSIN